MRPWRCCGTGRCCRSGVRRVKKARRDVLPAIDALLRGAGCAMDELDAFAVDVGPGSFTGVRIGVCLANGFALAMAKPVIPVDALRALYEPYAAGSGAVLRTHRRAQRQRLRRQVRDGRCVEAPRAVELAAYGAGLDGARLHRGRAGAVRAVGAAVGRERGPCRLHPFGRRGRAGEPAVSQAVAGGAHGGGGETMTPQIRPMRRADIQRVYEIELRVLPHAWSRLSLLSELRNRAAVYLVAEGRRPRDGLWRHVGRARRGACDQHRRHGSRRGGRALPARCCSA